MFNTNPSFKYELEEVWLPVAENILAWEQDFHQLMLDDQIRMQAYKSAIQEAVKPGMVVLDLGTGSGILGLWALQAGAKYLYGIEVNRAIIPRARETIERGGFTGKYEIFEGFSHDINLPVQVDLVISEIIGNLGDNEGFVPILADARMRFLKREGHMLPLRVRCELVPVNATKAHGQVAAKNCRALNAGYSLSDLMHRLAIKNPFNLYYDAIIPRACYLSEPRIARHFLFDGTDEPVYEVQLAFPVVTDGLFTGFKGSFVANLSASVVLDISGDDIASRATSDSWKHCYLPVQNALTVKGGDEIRLRYSRSIPGVGDSPFRQYYEWAGTVIREREVVGSFAQSTGKSD
jgi:SAM-dependent methyltransferase